MTDGDVVRLFHKANRWDVRGLKTFMHDLQQFAVAVQEEERERAAMICHACKDVEYASEEIARRIIGQAQGGRDGSNI
jgi:hypothetical protein